MTMQRISQTVSGQRAPIVTAAIGTALCVTAVAAVFATAGRSGSESSAESPSSTSMRIEVPSMSGVGVLIDRELTSSAFAEHDAYMEALFGTYSRPQWNPPVDLALARSEHEHLIDAELLQ